MLSIDQFKKYLYESNDDLDDKINQLANFIFKNNLINVIYEIIRVKNGTELTIKLLQIGAPNQLIDLLNHSVTQPLRFLEMDLFQIPTISRVYDEKKAIYFRNIPNLANELIPAIKFPQRFDQMLGEFKLSELAVIPLFFRNHVFNKDCILVVLGPLSIEQRDFAKTVADELVAYVNSHK